MSKKEMEVLNDEKLEQASGGMIGSQYKGQKNYDSVGGRGSSNSKISEYFKTHHISIDTVSKSNHSDYIHSDYIPETN